MKRAAVCVLAALALLWGAAAAAKEAVPSAADPVLEQRTNRLAEELRCLVCQNQTIADSNAPLAVDLKQQIREQVKAGRTDEQVMGFMVERYGDFVLYRPPFKLTTALLWAGPFVLLAVAVGALFLHLRRRRGTPAQGELSEEERARVSRLLAEQGERK
ncbi:MAG: cytochrome c-type biogenesis protein CcmH [Betaproteobacteria bacterium]|nr:cytochrome c-type biogenesis protein CcmH [Betaproteobacteria bacterium]